MSRRSVVLAVVLTLAAALPASADYLIKQKTTTSAVAAAGAPAQESTSTTWVGETRMAQDDGSMATIVDIEAKQLYVVDHSDSTYSVLDLPVDYAKISPELGKMIEQGMAQMKLDVEVTPTEERQEHLGYACTKYVLKVQNAMGIRIDIDLWVTDEIEMDTGKWKSFTKELATMQPGAGELAEKMMAIEGFPVVQESTISMMGNAMTTREELVSVEKKDPPEGTYRPPAGYAEKPFNPMAALSGQ
jgi:hypothetical protein